ncbi:2144_t:CDS:2, partial [Dentiscutata heterogama]
YEEFQTYLSKSVVESDDNAEVECNNNSPVECNVNFAEEYVENFTEFVVDQNFYAESIQESTGSSDTIHKNTININVGDTFYSWEIAETHLNQYASFSRVSIPNQVIDPIQQCQRPSRKIGQYNHPMVSDLALHTPKYRRLSNEIMEQIKFYVTKRNMESKQIYPLLSASFPNQIICKRDLYNTIQKFKAPFVKCQGDAQHIVNKLIDLQKKEAGW